MDDLGSLSMPAPPNEDIMQWEASSDYCMSHFDAVMTDASDSLSEAFLTAVEREFTEWASAPITVPDSEPLTIPSHNHNYVHDSYTPSYNNPFFDEFHAFHPREGSQTVDYY